MKAASVTWLASASTGREPSVSGDEITEDELRRGVIRRERQGRILNYIFDNETDSDRAEISRLLNEALEQIRAQDAAARAVLNRLPALTSTFIETVPSYEGVYYN